ncbi:hypothetical protein NU219Hw_g4273t1 [Hortaea werneckii]
MASSMGFVTDLPPEIRLEIYEYLLGFDCPLKRIKTIDELDGTLEDELRQYVRGDRIELGILFASRTTFREALPVFYKLNTASLCHDDVCLQNFHQQPFRRCDQTLVQNIVVVDWLESGPWTTCHLCSSYASSFFANFSPQHFPRLKQVTFDLEGFNGGHDALRQQILLLHEGLDAVTFEFTAVGCFRVKEPTMTPQINFTLNTIASNWSHFYHMATSDLWSMKKDVVLRPSTWQRAKDDVQGRFTVIVAQMIVIAHNSQLPANKQYGMAILASKLWHTAFDTSWLDPHMQTPEVFEKTTQYLLGKLERLMQRRG